MENHTCLVKFRFLDLTEVTNFSIHQIVDYCPLYAEYDQFQQRIDLALGLSFAITGAIGLVNNVLTFATFSNGSAFQGPSFLYHKAMAILELIHMVIMLQFGVLRSMQYPGNTYWMSWWRDCAYGGWMVGDSAKTAVNCLVMFVSLERMIAVCIPFKFDRFNRRRVAVGAIAVSISVGSLHLTGFAAIQEVVRFGGDYGSEWTQFGESILYEFIQSGINAVKLALGTITMALCVLVALGMYRKNKRALQMSNDAKKRWRDTKMGCYLQLTLGVTTVMAHSTFVMLKVVYQQQPYPFVGREAMMKVDSFDQALINLQRSRFALTVEMINALAAQIDHAGRFFAYLMFHKTFRTSFKRMWNRVWKTKVASQNQGHNVQKVTPV